MLAFFLCILFTRAEVPSEFRKLYKKALASKIKVPRDEREDTAYPGDYEFPERNIKFTLAKTLTSIKSKDIKGFAIEGAYVAIVKRKAFNIKSNIIAIADAQKDTFYGLTELAASDDKVNIYQAKGLNIFDVMHKFNYHAKTPSLKFTTGLNFYWNEDDHEPEMQRIRIKGTEIKGVSLGAGALAKLSIDFEFKWSNPFDPKIIIFLEALFETAAKIEFDQCLDILDFLGEYSTLFKKQFEIPYLSKHWSFLGIGLDITTSFVFEIVLSELKFCIPNPISYMKGYHLSASRSYEVTIHKTSDSGWKITKEPIDQVSGIGELLSSSTIVCFDIVPQARAYFECEVVIMTLKSSISLGLQVPFEFHFDINIEKCLAPYLYGHLTIGLEVFLEFSGLKVKWFKLWKFKYEEIELIKGKDFKWRFLEWTLGPFCIGKRSLASDPEEAARVTLNRTTSYYLVQNEFRWNTQDDNGKYRLAVETIEYTHDLDSYRLMTISPPRQYNIPVVPDERFIYTAYQTTPEFAWKLVDNNGDPLSGFSSTQKSIFSINASNTITYQQPNVEISYNSKKLTGSALVYVLKETQFKEPFNSSVTGECYVMNISCEDNAKYVILSLNSNGQIDIDRTAEFFSDTMFTKSDAMKGVYDANYNHFKIRMYEFVPSSTKFDPTIILGIRKRQGESSNLITRQKFIPVGYDLTPNQPYSDTSMRTENRSIRIYYPPDCEYEVYIKVTNGDQVLHDKAYPFNRDTKQQDNQISLTGLGIIKWEIKPIDINLVTVRSELGDKQQGVLTKVHSMTVTKDSEISGKIKIHFDELEVFKVLNISIEPGSPLENGYFIMRVHNVTIISQVSKEFSNDLVIVQSKNLDRFIEVQLRRTENYTEDITIEYLITDINNIDKMVMEQEGQVVTFSSTQRAAGFVVPTVNGKYDFYFLDKFNPYLNFVAFDIDDSSQFIAIQNTKANDREYQVVSFIFQYAIIPNGTLEFHYDVSHLIKLVGKNAEFPVRVYCNNTEIRSIRYDDTVQDLIDNQTTFTIKPLPSDVSTVTFYSVCKDDNGTHCELEYKQNFKGFQLIDMKNPDGINVTGIGMKTGILSDNNPQHNSYNKAVDETIEVLKNYTEPEPLIMAVSDVYPNDPPELREKTVKVNFKNDNLDKYRYSYTQPPEPSETPVVHNETGAYRKFCVYDSDGVIIPFSTRYLSTTLEIFMKTMGIDKNTSLVEFNRTTDDCFNVSIEMLESNEFSELPTDVTDLNATTTHLRVDARGVSFNPKTIDRTLPEGFGDSQKSKDTKSKKTIIIAAAAAVAGVAVIAAVAVVVIIVVRKQRRTNTSDAGERNGNYDEPDDNTDDLENNGRRGRNQDTNEDDKYCNTLLA